jgi:hypothetical protein
MKIEKFREGQELLSIVNDLTTTLEKFEDLKDRLQNKDNIKTISWNRKEISFRDKSSFKACGEFVLERFEAFINEVIDELEAKIDSVSREFEEL